MEWEFIVALVVAIPIVLLPVALVWYLNLGGIFAAFREARRKKAAKEYRPGAANDERKA